MIMNQGQYTLNALYRRKDSRPSAPDYRIVEIHSAPSDPYFNHIWVEVVYLDGLVGGSYRVHVADFALLYEAKALTTS